MQIPINSIPEIMYYILECQLVKESVNSITSSSLQQHKFRKVKFVSYVNNNRL